MAVAKTGKTGVWGCRPGERRGGRKKGQPNKLTKSVRSVFEQVFNDLQANPNSPAKLKNWANKNPTDFYRLAAKLIPLQVIGDPDHPLAFQDVTALSDAELEQIARGRIT